ncbi:MAG: hypothetical protein JXR34_11670 [Bacteroidales bacterium]|nr:hypothetical protein [Bacteroidales bacterium]
MTLKKILSSVTDKTRFTDLSDYISFCSDYLGFINDNLQAIIVSQNENNYCFYQYKKEANYQVTRPINTDLMINIDDFDRVSKDFLMTLKNIKEVNKKNKEIGSVINNSTYTIQQSIGAALDALPVGKSNTARKLNGDLFENFIRLILKEIGLNCRSGVVQIPVIEKGEELFKMSYQHDLIIEDGNDLKIIGSVKTSSKDRMDKIFIDKFLYNKLTNTKIPHIAIFLNDVQRKNTKHDGKFGINATFLPGHFKGYTVKLNPLDGVYYCDIRPNMKSESILEEHIKTFDNLLITDIWKLL